MGWWKKLKLWQKFGVFVGIIHLLIYMILLHLGAYYSPHEESGIGYLLVFMELPWMFILMRFGLGTGTYLSVIAIGIVGSILYGASAALAGWLLSIASNIFFPKQ